MTGEICVCPGEGVDAAIVHPQPVHLGHEFVADCSVDRPILRQPLVVLEDFLHVQASVRQQSAQPLEIAERISEAVRVIEPQSVELPLPDHVFDAHMRRLEHRGLLYLDAHEAADVEEAPVVGELARELPAVKREELPP